MALTDRLWEFNEGLNKGVVDWKFLYTDRPNVEERDRGFQMLISRGFVVAIPSKEGVPVDSGMWVVKGEGRILNPERGGNTLYFTSDIYATGYEAYLINQMPGRGLELEQI